MALTVEELVRLVESLTSEITVERIFAGMHADLLDHDPPIDMGVLVRFVSGERPTSMDSAYREALNERKLARRHVTLDPDGYPQGIEDDPNFEYDEDNDVYVPKRVERSIAQKELPLTGEFDGIVLP